MLFTVVTPVMNGMPWLPACVASIDAQRCDVDVEHIVFDPGSTDGSRDWLHHNALHAELVLERDEGQSDALARGFARAQGDVLLWLNADDVLEPGALRRVADALKRAPTCVGVTGACLVVEGEGRVIGAIAPPRVGSFSALLEETHNLAQPATFFRRDAFLACGGLDRGLHYAMDVDLWLKLARQGDFALLPREVLARFRHHPRAKTQAHPGRAVREEIAVRRRHGLSWTSHAIPSLLRYGYVQPALRRVARPVLSALARS